MVIVIGHLYGTSQRAKQISVLAYNMMLNVIYAKCGWELLVYPYESEGDHPQPQDVHLRRDKLVFFNSKQQSG